MNGLDVSERSCALGCGTVFLLIVGLGATYGLWSFHQECRNGVPRIITQQEAVRAASRILLERVTQSQLSLANDKPALATYIEQHPECCSTEWEFSPLYWDYVWAVKFYLRGYVKEQLK
jgi:hypothetical protein